MFLSPMPLRYLSDNADKAAGYQDVSDDKGRSYRLGYPYTDDPFVRLSTFVERYPFAFEVPLI